MQRNNKIKIAPLDKQPVELVGLLLDVTKGDFVKDINNPTISEKISFCSRYLNLSFGEVSGWLVKSIDHVFNKVIESMEQYVYAEPPKSITIDGVTFDLVTEPHKQTAGWWHHVEAIDANIDVETFLALNYIERGRRYAETDRNANVLNPTSERGALLVKHYSAKQYLDLMGFFLKKYDLLLKIDWVLNERNQKTKTKTKPNIPTNGVGNEPLTT